MWPCADGSTGLPASRLPCGGRKLPKDTITQLEMSIFQRIPLRHFALSYLSRTAAEAWISFQHKLCSVGESAMICAKASIFAPKLRFQNENDKEHSASKGGTYVKDIYMVQRLRAATARGGANLPSSIQTTSAWKDSFRFFWSRSTSCSSTKKP